MLRKTKIMGTLGPSCLDLSVLEAMLAAGLDALRINFSHPDHDTLHEYCRLVREASRRAGRPVPLLGDLQGPRPRVGLAPGRGVQLISGREVLLSAVDEAVSESRIGTGCPELVSALRPGTRVLLGDGLIELVVTDLRQDSALCSVLHGGLLESRKGINVPGLDLGFPPLTAKDIADLDFMLESGFEWAALSFVRNAVSVGAVRERIETGGVRMRLAAKIELPSALADLDRVLEAADSVLVARGDLGVEIGLECVPAAQKHILRQAAARGVESITSTHHLESMTHSPYPTRAEVSDIFNAVLDGADWILFTGETARGKYPVKVIEIAGRVIREAEECMGR